MGSLPALQLGATFYQNFEFTDEYQIPFQLALWQCEIVSINLRAHFKIQKNFFSNWLFITAKLQILFIAHLKI